MAEPVTNVVEFTVSEISAALKRTIEDAYGYVRVRGEISGYKGPHSSGHAYFTLKDDRARIEAVIWRMTLVKLRFKPEEGMEVVATGRITTFPGSSKYQIVIDALEPAGIGALMVQLEERKRRLAAEGLFAEARKKPLPYLPRTIGVITSPTGAVIRDILHRLSDRFPVNVLLWPVRVQGETCAAEVAAAISGFNALAPGGALPRPDVLIVARGGGSLEDLWGFNDEGVVRAAAASAIPLISAVGHETDTTLIDFAADRRAPTPTGAAEMAVPVRTELLAALDGVARRHTGAVGRFIETRRRELRLATRSLPTAENVLAIPRRSLDEAASRLGRSLMANVLAHRAMLAKAAGRLSVRELRRILERHSERLTAFAARGTRAVTVASERQRKRIEALDQLLRSLSYTSVLARGFAVVRDAVDTPIASAAGISSGDTLNIELRDGQVRVLATSSSAKRRARKVDSGPQGDLF
jgi:exodeoxyribonuclease VII large subunit